MHPFLFNVCYVYLYFFYFLNDESPHLPIYWHSRSCETFLDSSPVELEEFWKDFWCTFMILLCILLVCVSANIQSKFDGYILMFAAFSVIWRAAYWVKFNGIAYSAFLFHFSPQHSLEMDFVFIIMHCSHSIDFWWAIGVQVRWIDTYVCSIFIIWITGYWVKFNRVAYYGLSSLSIHRSLKMALNVVHRVPPPHPPTCAHTFLFLFPRVLM